jgi:hypothetical protein
MLQVDVLNGIRRFRLQFRKLAELSAIVPHKPAVTWRTVVPKSARTQRESKSEPGPRSAALRGCSTYQLGTSQPDRAIAPAAYYYLELLSFIYRRTSFSLRSVSEFRFLNDCNRYDRRDIQSCNLSEYTPFSARVQYPCSSARAFLNSAPPLFLAGL